MPAGFAADFAAVLRRVVSPPNTCRSFGVHRRPLWRMWAASLHFWTRSPGRFQCNPRLTFCKRSTLPRSRVTGCLDTFRPRSTSLDPPSTPWKPAPLALVGGGRGCAGCPDRPKPADTGDPSAEQQDAGPDAAPRLGVGQRKRRQVLYGANREESRALSRGGQSGSGNSVARV